MQRRRRSGLAPSSRPTGPTTGARRSRRCCRATCCCRAMRATGSQSSAARCRRCRRTRRKRSRRQGLRSSTRRSRPSASPAATLPRLPNGSGRVPGAKARRSSCRCASRSRAATTARNWPRCSRRCRRRWCATGSPRRRGSRAPEMALRIHNSLSGRKEAVEPLEPGHVRMYVCGITVYDHIHVGHARSQIAFDVARRWLKASGYRVTYVRNITDIDDKIIDRARERGEHFESLTARFIASMDEDFAAIGLGQPDHEPRATAFIPEIVAMIGRLVAGGHAYVGANGDVFYAVASFPKYGRLSGKKLADLRAGARVEVDESKRDPLDFVLWKRAKPGEPAWDSPWGMGRPGWHIECSAMAVALLGPEFDIHGGGMDLKFPHHENEIAQSCAACDAPFARLWMHNGFVRVADEKMSKSLRNFFTVREVLPRLRPEVLRAFLLASHYRAPVNYTEDNLRQADASLQRLYLALRDVTPDKGDATLFPGDKGDATLFPAAGKRVASPLSASPLSGAGTRAFTAAMDDDFNTPEALAAMQLVARELNVAKAAGDQNRAGTLAAELRQLGSLLGILELDPAAWLATRSELTGGAAEAEDSAEPAEIERLVQARIAARRARDWAESDRIRDALAARGILLEDGPAGTTWRRK